MAKKKTKLKTTKKTAAKTAPKRKDPTPLTEAEQAQQDDYEARKDRARAEKD